MPSHRDAILVCSAKCRAKTAPDRGNSVAASLSSCFKTAARGNYGLIVIEVPSGDILVRSHLLEVCRSLKAHPETKDTPLVVSTESLHRELIIQLAAAGVRFMAVAPLTTARLRDLVRKNDPSIRIDLILSRLCPFMDHETIDTCCELTTCRAYRNRMVLGGRRLHEVCETDFHGHCDYFLNPRFKS